mgnify:CR=1 FL=1
MKYGIWLDEWFCNYIRPSSKRKTCERYSEIIEKRLKVKLGEYELNELTPLILQRYITELIESGNMKTGKGLAANSVNGIITVIQNSLKLAYALGTIKEYAADKIRRPKTKEKEVTCFTLSEQKKIERAALAGKKTKWLGIVVCLYTGLRIGELLALEWKDVDFQKGMLTVSKSRHEGKDENGRYAHIVESPKTVSSRRCIPLPKQILCDIKWVMKAGIAKIPFVGAACRAAGFIFVDNSTPKAAARSVLEAERCLRNGASVVVFPEGSRTYTGKMIRFKKGAYQMALGQHLPIIPITLNGPFDVLPIGSLNVHRHRMEMVIHPAVSTENIDTSHKGMQAFADQTQEIIASALWEEYK